MLSGALSPGDGDGLPCAGDRSVKIIFCCFVAVRPQHQHKHGAQMALVTVTVTWRIALLTQCTLMRQVFASFALDVTRERSSSSTGEQGGWAEMACQSSQHRVAKPQSQRPLGVPPCQLVCAAGGMSPRVIPCPSPAFSDLAGAKSTGLA